MGPSARDIVVTEFDRRRLSGILAVLRARRGVDVWQLTALELELARARVVPPDRVPATVVTMNSRVRLRDLESGAHCVVSLVFPAQHTRDERAVAVLSPLGLALLGCSEGDVIPWQTARGLRRLQVEAVLYQPEASGNFAM